MTSVYILHLDTPLHHARHYVGCSQDVGKRIELHRKGQASCRFTQVLKERGIGFTLARVFDDTDRTFERKLKNTKNTARYCPLCSGEDCHDYHPKE